KLFDYPAANEGPIQLALNQGVVQVTRFRLVGEGTALELSGTVGLDDRRIALDASGDALISEGRVRYSALPHSLQGINGRLAFDAQGIRIVDAVAQLGGGPVHFGGRIGLD